MKYITRKRFFIILTVIVVVITAALVSRYLFQLMLVQGQSMEPGIKNHALVVVDKRAQNYNVGDVIVFKHKDIQGVIVKRIVAEGKDTVQIKDGKLYVNGELSDNMKKSEINYAGIANEELVVPEDAYFVLGDNYDNSKDSRFEEIGFVKKSKILGRVINR